MKVLKQGLFTGERALFSSSDIQIFDSVFCDGESPLKESSGIGIYGCTFKWKYPLWYCNDVKITGTTLTETARSGIWYTHGIEMADCIINAPKTFRRATGITLTNCDLPNAQETLWSCKDIRLTDVAVVGDYFGMNCENVVAKNLRIDGNYAFDGAKNIEIRNAVLISKDSFWNAENVTVYDSTIIGEYLGWNAKNVTLVNCTVESDQGMCYMENLTMVNCKVFNTPLAFEYSTVNADVNSEIDSVKNPLGGRIRADGIGEIIMDEQFVDISKTEIIVGKKTVSGGKSK